MTVTDSTSTVEQAGAEAPDAPVDAPAEDTVAVAVEEVLVEEISIDGMCGVY